MSTPAPGPRPGLDIRGAVDLSALARPATPPPGTDGGLPLPGQWTVDVTEAGFQELVESSVTHPVVVVLWATWSETSISVATELGKAADAYAGRFLLARVDAEAQPQIAAAFQAQAVPTVVAVLAGQPVPLFQGAAPANQVGELLEQLLAAAAANGITGLAPARGGAPAPEVPAEPELPPLHQAAYDAIEADDLEAAADAYEAALRENPRDDLARAGRAQVGLLRRTRDLDLAATREAAAARPQDVAAQLAVADLDLAGGKVEDAFGRLLDVIRILPAAEKDAVRARLLDLFEIVGAEDERVVRARRALANALY